MAKPRQRPSSDCPCRNCAKLTRKIKIRRSPSRAKLILGGASNRPRHREQQSTRTTIMPRDAKLEGDSDLEPSISIRTLCYKAIGDQDLARILF